MPMTRRDLLTKIAAGSVSAVAAGCVTSTALTSVAYAEEPLKVLPHAVGMLYDATRCVGCKSCVAACAEANNLQPDTRLDGLHQAPTDLNAFTKNIIKLYKPASGDGFSYVKQQCMHCVDPACVAGCSFHALTKDKDNGVVSWHSSLCSGCRYCQIVCPYHVPRFEWEGRNPLIVKCEMCKERLAAGKEPACTTVCPTRAVIFGHRDDLLAEAKKRIKETPGKYFEDRVFGEFEGGGTQVLYLSHVPFENLGFPHLGTESIPDKFLKWQKLAYSYMAVPVVLYVTMVGVMRKNWASHQEHMEEEQKKTGLRAQL
jgi:Fe-S-cluster-containing dehydrogenase component